MTHLHYTPAGQPVETVLDWTGRDGVRHWGGQLRPCRNCQLPTRLVDNSQQPQHKACAEHEADLAAAAAAVRQRAAATAGASRNRRAQRTAQAEPQAEALW